MTQPKLEIIGPYTPEHEGPWVLKNSENEAHETQCIVHAVVNGTGFITIHGREWPVLCVASELMNAREVPMMREFWIVEHVGGAYSVYGSKEEKSTMTKGFELRRTIHVREVPPGEGE